MVTEKEAREALVEAIKRAIHGYYGVEFETFEDALASTVAPIDALLAARTEAIAQKLDAFADDYYTMVARCSSNENKRAAMVAYSAVSIAAVKVRETESVDQ